ncbi:unnamed protein product [Prunus armeniaca]
MLAIGVEFKVNPVANLKSAFRAFPVMELLHSVLHKEQVVMEKTKRRVTIAKGGVNCLNRGSAREVRVNGGWGNPVEGLEGGHANCRVKTGVIPPFRPRKEGGPGLWLINREASKIMFEGTIEHLSLAISLGVIGDAMAKLGFLGFEEGRPEITKEGGITIGYYCFGHAMKAIDFFNKEVSRCGSQVRVGKSNKMSIFCQAINHNKDDVFPVGFGQSLYEVKGNVLPNGGGN